MFQTSTLRPGLLVSLKTGLTGNVRYLKTELEAPRMVDEKTMRSKWETEKTVADAAEFDAAIKLRSTVTYLIGRVCSRTSFGYLCPEDKADELEAAIKEARQLVSDFNRKARVTRLSFYVITGRVAPDDVEAVRAIRAEVRELMAEMERGVAQLQPEKIRDAANRARALGSMLTDSARKRVDEAVDSARTAARAIARAAKAGEQAAVAVDQSALANLKSARVAFLDLEEGERETAAPTVMVDPRAIDFDVAPALNKNGKPYYPKGADGMAERLQQREANRRVPDIELEPERSA